jgi:hypothetical protein
MNKSLSSIVSSPITTVPQHSAFYQSGNTWNIKDDLPISLISFFHIFGIVYLDPRLPFPLKWNAEYLYRIGLNSAEFFNYCRLDPTITMIPDPEELIFRFIDDHLKKTVGFWIE